MPWYVVAIMVLVILVLSVYAFWLLFRLAKQKRQHGATLVSAGSRSESGSASDAVGIVNPNKSSAHKLDCRESIHVLARCVLQDQVSTTEAAIRITALARGLPQQEQDGASYQAFSQLANATAHIPILDAWRALSRKEKYDFESERARIEGEHKHSVMAAAKALVTVQ